MQALLQALVAAVPEIQNPRKDSKNPHFRNSYASLEAVLDAVTAPLQRHGLVITQTMRSAEHGAELVTTLWHAESGEHLQSVIPVNPSKPDPQGVAAAVTYYRRLAIKALIGLAEVDDDGNEASAPARGRADYVDPDEARRRHHPSTQTAAPAATAKETPNAVQQVIDKLGGEQVKTPAAEVVALMLGAKTIVELEELTKRARTLDDAGKKAARAAYNARRNVLSREVEA